MSTPTTASLRQGGLGPTRPGGPGTPRLRGIDATIGLAVLGMMAVNSLDELNEDGSATTVHLVGGRSAAMFAVLAGVGIAFISGRRRVRPGPDGRRAIASMAVRGLLIGLIGLSLGYPDAGTTSVILPYYAVMVLLAIPLVFLPTGPLFGVGALLAGGMPLLSAVVRPGLRLPSLENPTLGRLVTDPAGLLTELTSTGHFPALPWLAYLAVGIAVGRLRLTSARVATGLLVAGAGLAATAETASWWLLGPAGGQDRIAAVTGPDDLSSAPTVADFITVHPEGVTPTTTWWWLATDAPHSGTPLDLTGTIGSSLTVLGVMLLLGHLTNPAAARLVGVVQRPLAAIGALVLTIYTLHVVFLNSGVDDFEPVPGYLLQVAVATLFALGWRLAVGRGPLESTVRVLADAAGNAARGKAGRP